jgi:hypothetical protein
VLHTWIRQDTFPAYTLEELSDDPLRLEIAELLATRGDAQRLQQALGELFSRPAPTAVDRMLLADALRARGSSEQAEAALHEAAGDDGRMGARACARLADMLVKRGQFAHAQPFAECAVARAPESISARITLADVLNAQGPAAEAIAQYRKAISLNPELPDVYIMLGLALLLEGDLREGFRHWGRAEVLGGEYQRMSAAPAWDGSPLGGQRLLILTNYGMGDVVQIVRFVAQLREREPRARFCLHAPVPLAGLMADTGLFERVHVGSIDQDDFDRQVTLTHLPLYGDLDGTGLRRCEHYLKVPPARLAQAAGWLPPRRYRRLRVGLRWAGLPSRFFDALRSVPFDLLRPLFEVEGVDWVALVEDSQVLAALNGHPMFGVAEHLRDFGDTAALMSHLDLVISVDTAVVHVAAGLNVPVWLLARAEPEWRWGRTGDRTPWYGAVRIFRHPGPPGRTDWSAMVREVAAALTQRVAQAGAGEQRASPRVQ